MFRGMVRTLLAAVAVLGVVSVAKAEITWVPGSSTWNTTNSFVPITYPGVPEGTGGATLSGPYGVGINSSNIFTLGFIKSTSGMVPGVIPTVEQSDLSGTVLGAGTVLNLVFTKGESDHINYIAMVGDGSQTVNYKVLSATSFSVQVSITSAVQSASGAAGVQFGMLIDYQANAQLDFKGTVFMTDIHYQDIAAPDSIPTGLAGLKANGANGVVTSFYAFLPLPLVSAMGINTTTGEGAAGYIDAADFDPTKASFTNEGVITNLGFAFQDSENPDNGVLKLKLTNSGWSAHNIQFGKLAADVTGPTITVKPPKSAQTKSATYTFRGTVTDATGVKAMSFSTTSKTKGFKKIKIKKGAWTLTLSSLKKGKTVKVYLKATDTLGNVSAITTLQVKRK